MENDPKKDKDPEEPAIKVTGSERAIAEAMAALAGKSGEKADKPAGKPPTAGMDALSSLLQQKDERLKEAHERLQRLAADFDNYKKRTKREIEESSQRAIESFITELLPVLDNLERTLESTANASDLGAITEGIRLTQRQMLTQLEKLGIKPIESRGKPFDPRYHEAVTVQKTQDVPHQHVLSESQRGYVLKDRLIRPARVVVADNPDKSPPGPQADDDLPSEPATRIKC